MFCSPRHLPQANEVVWSVRSPPAILGSGLHQMAEQRLTRFHQKAAREPERESGREIALERFTDSTRKWRPASAAKRKRHKCGQEMECGSERESNVLRKINQSINKRRKTILMGG